MHSSAYFGLAAIAGVLACAAAIAAEWRATCDVSAACARCTMTSLIAAKLSAIDLRAGLPMTRRDRAVADQPAPHERIDERVAEPSDTAAAKATSGSTTTTAPVIKTMLTALAQSVRPLV